MAFTDHELAALVDLVVAHLAGAALGLGRLWSGFADRLKSALRREMRGQELSSLIDSETRATGSSSGRILTAAAKTTRILGREHAQKILVGLLGRKPPLPPMGRPPDLGGFADDVARQVADRLKIALHEWHDQRQAEEQVVQITGEHLQRLLTGNQTEGFREYRGSLMRGYRAVHEVDRVVRKERLDSLTCAICWALDGEILDKREDIAVHPNCRGIPFPVLRGFEPSPSGARFSDLSPEEQRAILGKRKYEAYASGELQLSDLVGRGESEKFGPYVYEKPAKDLFGD